MNEICKLKENKLNSVDIVYIIEIITNKGRKYNYYTSKTDQDIIMYTKNLDNKDKTNLYNLFKVTKFIKNNNEDDPCKCDFKRSEYITIY